MLNPENIKNMLISKGFQKAYIVERDLQCTLFLCVYDDKNYLIAFYQGDIAIYSKLLESTNISSLYWKCEYLKYIPNGLYAFAQSIESLIDKVLHKIKLIQ